MGYPVVHFEVVGTDGEALRLELGLFTDPEGHLVGVVSPAM